MFLIRADKDAKKITSIVGHSGDKLSLDTDFQKYNHATQVGEVAFSPQIIGSEFLNNTPIKDGDAVLFHHFVCQDDNQVKYNGETLYSCDYFHIWAKIVDSKLEPLEDFIFVEPILEPLSQTKTSGGLVLKAERTNLKNIGRIHSLSKASRKLGMREGDIVFFTNDADYDINVLGKDLYRMRIRNIIGVERNSRLICLSNKLLVLDITDAEVRKGLMHNKNIRDRTGVIYNVGADIKGLAIGDKINYFDGVSSRLNYMGKNYSFLTIEDVTYKHL